MEKRELMDRLMKRDKDLERLALECERAGDTDGCWLAMATRAENSRLIQRITNDTER